MEGMDVSGEEGIESWGRTHLPTPLFLLSNTYTPPRRLTSCLFMLDPAGHHHVRSLPEENKPSPPDGPRLSYSSSRPANHHLTPLALTSSTNVSPPSTSCLNSSSVVWKYSFFNIGSALSAVSSALPSRLSASSGVARTVREGGRLARRRRGREVHSRELSAVAAWRAGM